MAKAKTDKLKTPNVLAFERKLDPSDALFFEGNWDARQTESAWTPISVREKSVRGTISNRPKKNAKADPDPAKLDAKIQNPNLQRVDVATLANDKDTLLVRFTIRILGGTGTPSACNDFSYQKVLLDTISTYKEEHGFSALAMRYAANLANGRFLWRNRMVAETVETRIDHLVNGKSEQSWTFDSLDLPLRGFENSDSLKELSATLSKGLSGDGYVLLEVSSYVRMGRGQEVYPSQELILDNKKDSDKKDSDKKKSGKKDSDKGKKGKILYSVNGIAGMHSQKIGNALRTIDDWYPGEDKIGPIAVEPFGAITSLGKAFRTPKEKHDFYTLLDKWVLKGDAPSIEQQHYVIANLIRGGVFGEKAE